MIQRYEPPQPRSPIYGIVGYSFILVAFITLAILYFRSVPKAHYQTAFQPAAYKQSSYPIAWPSTGEAAIGAVDHGVLQTHGNQTALPTASTAKLITALTVLKKYPLTPGQSGPEITLGNNDLAIFNKYYAEDGSLVKVQPGEHISEYQMLEGMLVPSGNNLADSLAIWAFGSLGNYRQAAQSTLKSLGLNSTIIGIDASGFDPSTVSTAHDLVLLGEAAMQNPVIAGIVSQRIVNLPREGQVYNYNSLLGQYGIVGIKTGNSTQAGGVYVFAAKYSVDSNHNLLIVGAIQGLPTLQSAISAAIPLLTSAEQNFSVVSAAKAGQTVAVYQTAWGSKTNATVEQNIQAVAWGGQIPKSQITLKQIATPQSSGNVVGSISYGSASSDVVLSGPLKSPSIFWRIGH